MAIFQLFYDTVTPEQAPAGQAACLYMDGLYKATGAQAARFAAVRWITVLGGADAAAGAGIADFESGNAHLYAGPPLVQWAVARQQAGQRARVYHNRGDMGRVESLLAGIPHEHWVATLDGNILSAGWCHDMWAVQFADQRRLSGANVDTSVLYGTW